MSGLAGKTVVLGITGGIAAYKAAELCRLLTKAGATVRVVMTEAATRFITPLTMQTLSGAPVALNLVDAAEEASIGHIRLADAADLIVVAPATANSIARFAGGLADDMLSAVVLASRAPVLLAPAMNVNMWENPLTRQNLSRLIGLGRFQTVGPDVGDLACGWVGEGRLIEPAQIAAAASRALSVQDLAGRRVVITAGPTFEPIDDVRFLGNRSSGKMGFALAEIAARRGATVTLIAGPVALATPPAGRAVVSGSGPNAGSIDRRDVETAAEMRAALGDAAATADAVIMAAAVADFRPVARAAGKLSRRGQSAGTAIQGPASPERLPLVANPDLLAELGHSRSGGRPYLVGFAAEIASAPAELESRARAKLREKGCDVIVANDVSAPGLGFGSDENAVTLIFADGASIALARAPKVELADAIWDRLAARLSGGEAKRRPASATGSRRERAVVERAAALRASRSPGGRRRRG